MLGQQGCGTRGGHPALRWAQRCSLARHAQDVSRQKHTRAGRRVFVAFLFFPGGTRARRRGRHQETNSLARHMQLSVLFSGVSNQISLCWGTGRRLQGCRQYQTRPVKILAPLEAFYHLLQDVLKQPESIENPGKDEFSCLGRTGRTKGHSPLGTESCFSTTVSCLLT